MELHKAIKQIVDLKGNEIIMNAQIINFLLDYQAFKEKPATKLILRDIINSGYAEEILSLGSNNAGWQIAFMKYERDFIDSCGYKDDLVKYVFEAIAYGIGLQLGSDEPRIAPDIDVDSFFDIPEDNSEQPSPDSDSTIQNQNVNPSDLYSIALTFYNEGKYAHAKGFIDKSVSLFHNSDVPSIQLKLKGNINMKLGNYAEAITDYNKCFDRKASEVKLKIDDLREQLKEHKIKGFENSSFYYYYCLRCLNKINDAQWKLILRRECLYGLSDAIKYCASINFDPINEHFDIYFSDRNLLKTGDFLYDDGSFSHEKSSTKDYIGIIVLCETSEYERSQGWTHGYIIGRVTTGLAWSLEYKDLSFPHSHYSQEDLNHWNEIRTIESEQFIDINQLNLKDYPLFERFSHVMNVSPMSGSSNWFIPSIHSYKRMQRAKDKYNGEIWLSGWTSSQSSDSKAISVTGSLYRFNFYIIDKKSNLGCLQPIAAF